MAYTTAAAVKSWGNIIVTSDDVVLTALIPQVQAAIDAYCNRTFEATADSTRRFDALLHVSPDGQTLYLDEDLCAITTVTNGDSTVITSSQYVTEPRNEVPYYALTMKASSALAWTYDTTPENAISIVGRWAYATSAPADIQLACIKWVLYLLRNRTADGGDKMIVNAAGIMLQPAAMPKDIQALLKRYRRIQD